MDGRAVDPAIAKEIARKKRLALAKLKQRQYQKTHATTPTNLSYQTHTVGSVSSIANKVQGTTTNISNGQSYRSQHEAGYQPHATGSSTRTVPHDIGYEVTSSRQQPSLKSRQSQQQIDRTGKLGNQNAHNNCRNSVINLTGVGDSRNAHSNPSHVNTDTWRETCTGHPPEINMHPTHSANMNNNTHSARQEDTTCVSSGLPNSRDRTQRTSNSVADGTLNSFCKIKNTTEMPSMTPAVKVKVECELIARDTVSFKPQSTLHGKFKQIMREELGVYEPKKLYWKVPIANYLSAHRKLSQAQTFTIFGLPRFLHNEGMLSQLLEPEDTTTHSMDDTLLPPETLEKLLPFQVEGIQWAIRRNGRALIADEMGLGKTVQAVCIACYYGVEWPALVVVPSSLRYQWREAFLKWVPVLRKSEVNVIDNGKSELGNAGVNIITYDLISKFALELKRRQFKVLILDECQKIKNPTAKRTMELLPLCKIAKRVLLLSGTPATSRPVELFTAIQAVRPEMFRNGLNEYGMRYCGAYKGPFGWNFDGQSRAEEIKTILKEFVMIRRLKSEVQDQIASLQSLTKKIRQRVNIEIDEKSQKRLADTMRRINQINSKNFIEYFHETAVAKTPAVCDYIDKMLDQPVKFVVFCQHNEMMTEIEYVMEKKSVDYIRIDGSTNSKSRQKKATKFQEVPTCRVALLSLLAANAGLTLTASATVIFAELAWNPGDLLQAEDRVHRISQSKDVTIQYLHAPNTMDDVMWEKLNKKLGVLGKAGLGNRKATSSKRSAMDTESLMSTSQGVAAHGKENIESEAYQGESKPTYRSAKRAKTLLDFLGSPTKVPDDDDKRELLDEVYDDDDCVFLDCS